MIASPHVCPWKLLKTVIVSASGNLFSIVGGDDVLMQAPAITSYQGALMELRRLQQFALKFNDYELHEILFKARCAAEDRSAARVVAEKYLTIH